MRGELTCVALAALILLMPLTCGAGEFRAVDVEGLRISIDSDWGTRTAPGYLPIRFDITNLGDARVIEIVGEGMRYARFFRSAANIQVLQSVRLARGDRVRITIPVPVFAESENIRFEIQERGETLQRFSYTGFQSGTPAANASALIVGGFSSPLGRVASSLLRPVPAGGSPFVATLSGGSSGRTTAPTLDFVLEPARLPVNWLGYTSLRAVVIGPAEWMMLDDAQRGALLTWTACGGDLIYAADDAMPLVGGGHRAPDPVSGGAARAYFFGRVHRRSADAIAAAGLATVLSDAAGAQDADWGLPANRTRTWGVVGPRGFRLPIPGVSGVPTRAYLSILILFSFLIGPVNYWLLWRRRRLVLFVLTAPLISVMFIVLLAGYVVAGEGFHVSGRALSFTMLDQARKQAVTRGTASLYAAGMTPGGGLRFPRDVAVYSIGSDGSGSRDDQTLDLTETQRFSSGIIHARAPANVEEIGFRPARERLTFTRDGGGVRVVNGLGAAIERLSFRSGGRVYTLASPLADGASATLTPGAIDPAAFVPRDSPLQPRLAKLFEAQPDGSYLAVVERSPFWEPGVTRLVERGSFHLVLGWPDGQP
jgi:hypothetical protein